jgi:hypothetical protein
MSALLRQDSKNRNGCRKIGSSFNLRYRPDLNEIPSFWVFPRFNGILISGVLRRPAAEVQDGGRHMRILLTFVTREIPTNRSEDVAFSSFYQV